jgi:hypothetical protein
MQRLRTLTHHIPWEQVQVPSRPTHIDRLLDFRGESLHGGLFHLLRPWCEGRLVALEHESGEPGARKLRMQMGKLWMAAAGRRQGDVTWPAVQPGQPITLLIVSPRARAGWFMRWGLPAEQVVAGLWVHVSSTLDVVLVHPRRISQVPGGRAWGLLSPDLTVDEARQIYDRLLGDPVAATFQQQYVAELLYQLYPPSDSMNQIQAQATDSVEESFEKSVWHMLLRLKQERDTAREALVEAHLQRVAAEQQREELRQTMIQVLAARGGSTPLLEQLSLEELRKRVTVTG